jgi:hypothetical protein
MAKWQNGRMAEWQNGRMAEWQNGRMAEWQMLTALQSFLGSHIIPQFDLIHNKHDEGQIRCCVKDVSSKGHDANQDS